jgi:hypothetical protein
LVEDKGLALWLIEAALVANGAQLGALQVVLQSPALFPFSVCPVHPADIARHNRLELFRQGLDDAMLMVRGHEAIS